MCITVGSKGWLVNRGEQPATIAAGTHLAGFYKGRWWHPKGEGDNLTDQDIPFSLASSEDHVLHQGSLVPVGVVIRQKRENQPGGARVDYHDLTDAPSEQDPAAFKLQARHLVAFKLETLPGQVKLEEGADSEATAAVDVTLGNVASALPPAVWNSNATELVWVTKWSRAKGLQPVRPVVVFNRPVTLPANRAVLLTAPAVCE